MNVPPPLGLSRPSRSNTRYELVVIQQPIHARCCGFGEKDRRLIDPPIILQLFTVAENGDMIKETNADSKLYVVHCDLYCENRKEIRSVVYLPSSVPPENKRKRIDDYNPPIEEKIISLRQPKSVRNLTGSLTANASHLLNENKEPGTYFVFHDLSVRTDGRFTLKFMFMDLAAGDPFTMSTSVTAEVFSNPFTVYTAKKFPGMTESTPLSRAFASQGVKIVTRKEPSYTRASEKYYKMPLAAATTATAATCSSTSIATPINISTTNATLTAPTTVSSTPIITTTSSPLAQTTTTISITTTTTDNNDINNNNENTDINEQENDNNNNDNSNSNENNDNNNDINNLHPIDKYKAALHLSIASITHPTNIEFCRPPPVSTLAFAAPAAEAHDHFHNPRHRVSSPPSLVSQPSTTSPSSTDEKSRSALAKFLSSASHDS
ncbi:velvet factor-domain-containing protein [Phascolomyces articulosus]|uniref:Velvet factor-domain-containing protein n=1 Tax=Phascolomyces articulosus TaxID=60185 RepID=A0AAD5JWQ9_9FUNG|nr:velvet factor-domain-containing protein [Phascolomyces articulosus]